MVKTYLANYKFSKGKKCIFALKESLPNTALKQFLSL
jgi:hypothetical protein